MNDENPTTDPEAPFTCPRCGFRDKTFHQVCPECGRPYFRDYIDTQFFPVTRTPRESIRESSGPGFFLC